MDKVCDPLPETKSDLKIFEELAARLEIFNYNDRTDEEWIRNFVAATPELPEYETFRSKGYHEIDLKQPLVAFREQIDHPDRHHFPTPSGKIEIRSQKLAELSHPSIPAIPKYIEPWEGPADLLCEKYPLQLISPHSKARVNSTLDNIPRLKASAEDRLWLNYADAEPRGIRTGDRVKVLNDRGHLLAFAKVTSRIMPGVASLDAGVWFCPDQKGIDHGGCVNVLTKDEMSPGGAFASNSCLVQVEVIS
jgi:anaerobic dimethyl sulfoxide reductase subunit A